MLSLSISRRSELGSSLEVSRHFGGNSSLISSYFAEGFVPAEGTYPTHRVVLNDSFDRDDVRLFGRHGIIELSATLPATGEIVRFYITGGRGESTAAPVPSLLRLSAEDHRQLLFLLRSDPTLMAEVASHNDLSADSISPGAVGSNLLARLFQIVGNAVAVTSPFVFTSVLAAQCKSPNDGGHYASGNGYNGIDSSTIQNQEGNNVTGLVPTQSSGVTTSGMDWGQHTASDARNLGISQSTIDQFSPFLAKGPGKPLIGPSAQAVMAQYPSSRYTLSTAQQQQIYASVYPKYFSAAAASFNAKAAAAKVNFQFSQMPVQWQTATASMYFQAAGGNPSGSGGSRFMGTQFASQIINQQWSAALANLKNYGASSAENNRALSNYNYLTKSGCTSGK